MTKDPLKFERTPEIGQSEVRWYLRTAARTVLKEAKLALKPKADSFNRPVVILFEPRSGSTWLVEMMARVRSVVTIADPLTERNAWLYARFYRQPLRRLYFTEAEMDANRRLLDDVFALKRASGLDLASAGLRERVRTPVIENVNTPWASDWYSRNYNAQMVSLIRHPIPTIRSQMRFFRMPITTHHSAAHSFVRERLSSRAFAALEAASISGDEFQARMAQMFVRYLPLIEDWPRQGAIVSYEKLLADDFTGLEFLAELDEDWQAKMRLGRNRPSRSTVSTTKAAFRTGVGLYSDAERACLSKLIDAFDAEEFMTAWGYMPD